MATLEVYLIRHGVAAERGDQYPDDSKRPLTSQGISRLRDVARGLDALGVGFDLILTSPLVRTRQTADVIAETMKSKAPVSPTAALAPEGMSVAVVQELGRHTKHARIALVGHEPNIGELAAHLLGCRHPIPFKKGAVGRIDFEQAPSKGEGQLIWLATPRMLRSLA